MIRRLFAWLGRHIITGCDSRWPTATRRYPVQHTDPGHMPPLKPSLATDAWRLHLNQDAFDAEFEAIAAHDDPDYRNAAYIRDLFRDKKER